MELRRRLFFLNGFQVFSNGVQPYLSPVLIRFDFMEDRPPNRHLAIAVHDWPSHLAFDQVPYTLAWKFPVISSRDQGQIWNPMLEDRRRWPSPVGAVTRRAVVLKNLCPIQRITPVGVTSTVSALGHASERKQQ